MCGCNKGVTGHIVTNHAVPRAVPRRVMQTRVIQEQPPPQPPRPPPISRFSVGPMLYARNPRAARAAMNRIAPLPPPPTYNADTTVWGANLWKVLHTLSVYAEQSQMETLVKLLVEHIPCTVCKQHFTAYVQATPFDSSVKWFFTLHNDINRRLGKPEFPEDGLVTGDKTTLGDLGPVIQELATSFPPEVIQLLQAING